MKNTTAISKTSGNHFHFRYDVFTEGRETMHSCEIEVSGAWRSASVMVMGEEMQGISEWLVNGRRNEVKFIVSPTEDTIRMVSYAKEDAAQYSAERAAKAEAAINQETLII